MMLIRFIHQHVFTLYIYILQKIFGIQNTLKKL